MSICLVLQGVVIMKTTFTSLQTSPALVLLNILSDSDMMHLSFYTPRFGDSRLKSSSADQTDIKISQGFVRV